jgi:PAS domain S-box-containing protein
MSDRGTVLQNVFDTIPTGIFVVDIEWPKGSEPEDITFRYVTTNPAYARMLSVPTNALAGRCPHDCFPSDIAQRFCTNYSRCLGQRQPISYEESLELNECRCTLLTLLSPIFAPDGRISQIIGSSQEVTANSRVEKTTKPCEETRAQPVELASVSPHSTNKPPPVDTNHRQGIEDFLELMRLPLEHSAIMACLVDRDARFLYVNDTACQLLGYSREEFLAMSVADVTPDFPPEAWPQHWQQVKQRRSFTFEAVKQKKDNQRFPAEITVNYFEFNDQEYNLVLVRDITSRKQTEDALSQEKELLSTLINNNPIGIISTDESGKILLVNPAFEKICGYCEAELVSQLPPYPYWDIAELDQIYQEFGLAMSGKKEQIELWFTRKNGERFLARLKPITIFDARGNMLRHLATMEDITKYKQAEAELYKALEREIELNELKTRFIAMVSHEYRTPLTTILSSAELLERYVDQYTTEKRLQHYRRIQSAVDALTQLVSDVLTISKIDARKQEFNASPLDLEKFCRERLEDLQQTMESQHTLVFTTEDGSNSNAQSTAMPTAYMDEKLLRYIIINLLSNAIKYSPQGSTVKFHLACHQSSAILRLQDEGIGIPLNDQQHVFESFYRGSNTRNISGTGLGLAIVKKAVDLHGGQITLESQEGVGTTFTVTLPLNNRTRTSGERTEAIDRRVAENAPWQLEPLQSRLSGSQPSPIERFQQ